MAYVSRARKAKLVWDAAPKKLRRKVVRSALKDPIKKIKKARKLYKVYKKLPGFDAKFAKHGKWHYKGQDYYLDEEAGRWKKPKNSWMFAPLTAPVNKWINNNVPGLKKPKPGFKRRKGGTERSWDELSKPSKVEYFDMDGKRLDI